MKVMVVDDQPSFLRVAERVLGADPEVEVVTAVLSAADAWLALDRGLVVDIALVDLSMPDVDGIEAIARIRRDHPSVIAVLMSTYERDELPRPPARRAWPTCTRPSCRPSESSSSAAPAPSDHSPREAPVTPPDGAAASPQYGAAADLRAVIAASNRRRVTGILRMNLVILATVIAGLIVVQTRVVASGWILAILAMTLLHTASMLWALRRSARGELGAAVTVMNVTVWPLAVLSTVIVPEALPITALSGLAPVLLAVPELPRRTTGRLLTLSVLLTLVIVVVGTTTNVTGLGDRVPSDVLTVAVTMAVPALVLLVLVMGWQNHALLMDRASALREASARFVAATDRERRRLERDLHDGAQQQLHGALVQLALARRLIDTDPVRAAAFTTDATEQLEVAITELRDLIDDLRPAVLVDRGLAGALQTLSARGGPSISVHTDLAPERSDHRTADPALGLSPDVQAVVWFCCLEAVANAERHGGPGIAITVRARIDEGGTLRFEVADDGRGMTVPDPIPPTGGLRNMTERLRALGGTLELESRSTGPGRGTVVRGVIPPRGGVG